MFDPVSNVAAYRAEVDDLATRLLAGEHVGVAFAEAVRDLQAAVPRAGRPGTFGRLCADIVARPRWPCDG